ncbi:hypothetical protein ACSTI7_23400, partial [Vibrio parahaemolyticus]
GNALIAMSRRPDFQRLARLIRTSLANLLQWGDRAWLALTSRNGLIGVAIAALVGLAAAADYATLPPPMPGYAEARHAFQPSEAWLYDR